MNGGPVFAIVVVTILAAVDFVVTLRAERPLSRSDCVGLVVISAIWAVFVIAMAFKV